MTLDCSKLAIYQSDSETWRFIFVMRLLNLLRSVIASTYFPDIIFYGLPWRHLFPYVKMGVLWFVW